MLLGDLELVRALLALGASANAQRVKPDGSGDRTTPLFWVCWGVHREYHEVICRLLLEAGADATARNSYADTPLHWAAERCNYAVCKQLLDAGADADAKSDLMSWRETPLYRFLERSVPLKAESKAGFFSNILRDKNTEAPPAPPAADDDDDARAESELVALFDLLKGAGADVGARTKRGSTQLHAAAKGGSEALVRALLKAGAKKGVADKNGQTALHWAALWGREKACKALAEAGEDPNLEDLDGKTPLVLADEQKHAAAAGVLKPLTKAQAGGARGR